MKISTDKFIEIAIDKMLEKYSVGFNFVKENETINGIPWFQYYTWTESECAEYKKWFVDYLSTNVKPKYSKTMARKEFMWFDLMWGLKIKKNDKKT